MTIPRSKKFRNGLIAIAALAGFTVVVLYSWNSFAPELFQLPVMKFRHAVGLVLFTGSISFLLQVGGRNGMHFRGGR